MSSTIYETNDAQTVLEHYLTLFKADTTKIPMFAHNKHDYQEFRKQAAWARVGCSDADTEPRNQLSFLIEEGLRQRMI